MRFRAKIFHLASQICIFFLCFDQTFGESGTFWAKTFGDSGDKGVNIKVGVKKSDYNTSYECDPEQYAGLSGEGEMVVTFDEAFKGKNIDLLDIQGLAPGVEVSLKKVYLIKNDDSQEEVSFAISWGWNKSVVGKAAYADPIIVFPSLWSMITVSTDENGTLVIIALK